MSAGALGYLAGIILLVALLPAAAGGLFQRTPPSTGRIIGCWALSLLLGLAAVSGGGQWWAVIVAWLLLAVLTSKRLAARP